VILPCRTSEKPRQAIPGPARTAARQTPSDQPARGHRGVWSPRALPVMRRLPTWMPGAPIAYADVLTGVVTSRTTWDGLPGTHEPRPEVARRNADLAPAADACWRRRYLPAAGAGKGRLRPG